MKCNHIYRSGALFEGHKLGGVSLGKCQNDVLKEFVVCYEHVTKDALLVALEQHQKKSKK